MAQMKILENRLRSAKTKEDLGDSVETFEAYQAQTKLPLVRRV